MSHILFADSHGEVRISGRERAYVGSIVRNFPHAFADPEWDERVTQLVDPPEQRWQFGSTEYTQWYRTRWAVGSGFHSLTGQDLNPWQVSLNTVSALGSDEMRVAAWVDGQCEVHGYIEGRCRPWLAGLIESGMKLGIFRDDPAGYDGWAALVEWLRDGWAEPVVMSYSVEGQFPEPPPGLEAEMEDMWWGRPAEVKWADGLERLRAGEGNIGGLTPGNLATRRYGQGMTILELLAQCERVDA